jgi:hypothetical protein
MTAAAAYKTKQRSRRPMSSMLDCCHGPGAAFTARTQDILGLPNHFNLPWLLRIQVYEIDEQNLVRIFSCLALSIVNSPLIFSGWP